MSKEIALGIIERVKLFLKTSEENSPIELLQLLRRHRTNFHPDNFTDEQAKKDANLKFIEISNLIEELDSHIQRERVNKSPMELALYQPLYENSALQSKLDSALHELEEMKTQKEFFENQIDSLKEDLRTKQTSIIADRQNDLMKIYRPSNNRIVSASFLLVLSGAIPIVTKIDAVSDVLTKYAPLSSDWINGSMLFVFFLVIFFAIKKFVEYRIIKNRIAEAKSPDFVKRFVSTLPNKKGFSESQVFEFIYGKSSRWKSILAFLGVSNFKSETTNQLKDVFIHNLIYKQLIDIGYAEALDRYFKIREKPKYWHEIND